MDGGSYMSESRSWRDTPLYESDGKQDMVAVFTLIPLGEGEIASYRGNYIRLAH